MVCFSSALARAQPHNPVLAESLYDEGKQLFFRKDFKGACPKLAESDRLDPAGGTVLMLGECYEGERKIASARAAYDEAISRARRDRRPDREKEAKTHLKAIEAKIPKYVIDVSDAVKAIPGLEVKSAGVAVPPVSFGIGVFGDPGAIEITASAPGYQTFHGTVKVVEGETSRIEIGALARHAPEPVLAPHPDPAPPLSRSPSSAAVPVAVTLGGLGVVALAVGGYFGAVAIRDAHTVHDRCGGAPTCNDLVAVKLAQTANGEANASDVLLPLGAAAVVAGIVVFVVGSPSKASRAALVVPPSGAPLLGALGVF